MDADFTLHPQLAADCTQLGDLPLCRLLLMNDARYPWMILVPRRAEIREVYELEEADQAQLWRESAQLSRALMKGFSGHKLNIAALGNLVPQLHVHHIVRYRTDQAWPAPVFGRFPPMAYTPEDLSARLALLKGVFWREKLAPAPLPKM